MSKRSSRRRCRSLLAWLFTIVAGAVGAELYTVARTLPSDSNSPTFTRVDQIRSLSPDEAAHGFPVHIRGVITMDAPAPDFFIQDSTAGIYVEGDASSALTPSLGDLVELEGITGPGKFAPVIRERRIRVLGKGILPKSRLFSLNELADGQHDSQWAQIRGIVRSATIDRRSWREMALAMQVMSDGGEFQVRVPIAHEQDFSSWVESEISIEGVCGSLYSANRQLTGILFYVPRLSFVKVQSPAPPVPLAALLRFQPGSNVRHPVRIRGVVEYQQLGNALFLQSDGKGVRVLTQQRTTLQAGDVVDVTGFPAMGESAPMLEDAVFHRVGHADSPTPAPLDFGSHWEQFDGAIVTTDATIIDRQIQSDGLRLTMRHGDVSFDATLQSVAPQDRLLSIPVNSTVRITGICLVRSGGLWRIPQSLRLLLRSPEDVTLIKAPPWWNLHHTLWLLGITAAILFAVTIWVVVLGRRLREQMEMMRQKLKHSAVLEERNRIARELHDTLEQKLAGITMQLDLAVDCFQPAPQVARHALEAARNMSRHSMIEARRSVWDLRCQLLEEGDLVSALTQIVGPLALHEYSNVNVKIEGTPMRLAPAVEMNFLRIGQEAVANAAKHGHATHIEVELRFTATRVRLTVSDDGRGFAAEDGSPIGHFGLLDMRERAQSMASQLEVSSIPGRGTRIAVEVPAPTQEMVHAELKDDSYSSR